MNKLHKFSIKPQKTFNKLIPNKTMASICALLFFMLAISSKLAKAADPDLIVDYLANPPNATMDSNFFTFTGLRSALAHFPPNFKPTKATTAEFPALLGQSVAMAILQFPAGALNPPHVHPRSAELLLVLSGSLQVGFVDTTNKLFNQTLQVGDVFLFPKGMVHFQLNADPLISATAIAAFASANPGVSTLALTLFNSGISDEVLAKALRTDVDVIESIKANLAPPPS